MIDMISVADPRETLAAANRDQRQRDHLNRRALLAGFLGTAVTLGIAPKMGLVGAAVERAAVVGHPLGQRSYVNWEVLYRATILNEHWIARLTTAGVRGRA